MARAAAIAPEVFASPSNLPQFQLAPPGQFGHIADYFNAASNESKLVVLIQDLHAHYGVQKNIASILDFVTEKLRKPERIGVPFALAVEGASGPVDSSVAALFPDQKVKEDAAQYLMREGELTGAEYFAIKHGLPNLLVGVEDDRYYTIHRDLFRKTFEDRSQLTSALKPIQKDVTGLPRFLFRHNHALRDFEKKVLAHDVGEISTHEFIGLLVSALAHPPLNDGAIDLKRDFPALASFATNSRFGTVEQIRAATSEFLNAVQGQLSSEERANLKSLSKNSGTSAYYLYMRDLVYRKQLFLAVPPDLAQYMEYIHTAQTMGMDQVLFEAKELAFREKLALAQTGEKQGNTNAADLVRVDHDLDLLARLADLQATELEVRSFAPRLNQFVAICKALKLKFDEPALRRLISSSIDFYAMALLRNQPMVDNTLALIGGSSRPSVAVLVTGGFHTNQLTSLLRQKNVSYIVITPTVENLTDRDHDLYIKRLNGEFLNEQEIINAATQSGEHRSMLAGLFKSRADNSLAVGLFGLALAPHILDFAAGRWMVIHHTDWAAAVVAVSALILPKLIGKARDSVLRWSKEDNSSSKHHVDALISGQTEQPGTSLPVSDPNSPLDSSVGLRPDVAANPIPTFAHGTKLVSIPGRLERVDRHIASILPASAKTVVVAGVGYPAATPLELAKTLKPGHRQARVIGLDHQYPATVMELSHGFMALGSWQHATVLFDAAGEVLGLNSAPYSVTGKALREEFPTVYQSVIHQRDELVRQGKGKSYQDSAGNRLIVNPLNSKEIRRSGVRFVEGDIFRPPFAPNSVDLWEDFNLGAVYYESEAERAALMSAYETVISPGGRLIFGLSGSGDREEYTVFEKADGHLNPESFVFSFDSRYDLEPGGRDTTSHSTTRSQFDSDTHLHSTYQNALKLAFEQSPLHNPRELLKALGTGQFTSIIIAELRRQGYDAYQVGPTSIGIRYHEGHLNSNGAQPSDTGSGPNLLGRIGLKPVRRNSLLASLLLAVGLTGFVGALPSRAQTLAPQRPIPTRPLSDATPRVTDWRQFSTESPTPETLRKLEAAIMNYVHQHATSDMGNFEVSFHNTPPERDAQGKILFISPMFTGTHTNSSDPHPQNSININLAYWFNDEFPDRWDNGNMDISLRHELHHVELSVRSPNLRQEIVARIEEAAGPVDEAVKGLISQALWAQEEMDCDNAGRAAYRMETGNVPASHRRSIDAYQRQFRKAVEAMPVPVRDTFKKMFPNEPDEDAPLRLGPPASAESSAHGQVQPTAEEIKFTPADFKLIRERARVLPTKAQRAVEDFIKKMPKAKSDDQATHLFEDLNAKLYPLGYSHVTLFRDHAVSGSAQQEPTILVSFVRLNTETAEHFELDGKPVTLVASEPISDNDKKDLAVGGFVIGRVAGRRVATYIPSSQAFTASAMQGVFESYDRNVEDSKKHLQELKEREVRAAEHPSDDFDKKMLDFARQDVAHDEDLLKTWYTNIFFGGKYQDLNTPEILGIYMETLRAFYDADKKSGLQHYFEQFAKDHEMMHLAFDILGYHKLPENGQRGVSIELPAYLGHLATTQYPYLWIMIMGQEHLDKPEGNDLRIIMNRIFKDLARQLAPGLNLHTKTEDWTLKDLAEFLTDLRQRRIQDQQVRDAARDLYRRTYKGDVYVDLKKAAQVLERSPQIVAFSGGSRERKTKIIDAILATLQANTNQGNVPALPHRVSQATFPLRAGHPHAGKELVVHDNGQNLHGPEDIQTHFKGRTTDITVHAMPGVPVTVQIPSSHLQELRDAGWSETRIGELLQAGLTQHLARGDSLITQQQLEALKHETIFFAIADSSPHLWEDHLANRRIFMNRSLLDLKQAGLRTKNRAASVAADAHFAAGFSHELIHEATGRGLDIEEALSEVDWAIVGRLLAASGVRLRAYRQQMEWLIPQMSPEDAERMKRAIDLYIAETRPTASRKPDQAIATDWHVHIKAVKLVATRRNFQVYNELVASAGDLLTRVSPQRMADVLRTVSGDNSIDPAHLSKEVDIEYFAEGKNKFVFKVTFHSDDGTPKPLLLALKKEQETGSISETEMADLKRISGKGVPRFGMEMKANDGRTWYIEEFIEGSNGEALAKENKLTANIRESIVSTLVAVATGLGGAVPKDFHAKNFVVRNDEAVLVDLGEQRLRILGDQANPDDQVFFLALLLRQYGYRGPENGSAALFGALKGALGADEAQRFLDQVYQRIKEKGIEALATELSEQGNPFPHHNQKQALIFVKQLLTDLELNRQRAGADVWTDAPWKGDVEAVWRLFTNENRVDADRIIQRLKNEGHVVFSKWLDDEFLNEFELDDDTHFQFTNDLMGSWAGTSSAPLLAEQEWWDAAEIITNAVENVVQHGRQNGLLLILRQPNGSVTALVLDKGRGMDVAKVVHQDFQRPESPGSGLAISGGKGSIDIGKKYPNYHLFWISRNKRADPSEPRIMDEPATPPSGTMFGFRVDNVPEPPKDIQSSQTGSDQNMTNRQMKDLIITARGSRDDKTPLPLPKLGAESRPANENEQRDLLLRRFEELRGEQLEALSNALLSLSAFAKNEDGAWFFDADTPESENSINPLSAFVDWKKNVQFVRNLARENLRDPSEAKALEVILKWAQLPKNAIQQLSRIADGLEKDHKDSADWIRLFIQQDWLDQSQASSANDIAPTVGQALANLDSALEEEEASNIKELQDAHIRATIQKLNAVLKDALVHTRNHPEVVAQLQQVKTQLQRMSVQAHTRRLLTGVSVVIRGELAVGIGMTSNPEKQLGKAKRISSILENLSHLQTIPGTSVVVMDRNWSPETRRPEAVAELEKAYRTLKRLWPEGYRWIRYLAAGWRIESDIGKHYDGLSEEDRPYLPVIAWPTSVRGLKFLHVVIEEAVHERFALLQRQTPLLVNEKATIPVEMRQEAGYMKSITEYLFEADAAVAHLSFFAMVKARNHLNAEDEATVDGMITNELKSLPQLLATLDKVPQQAMTEAGLKYVRRMHSQYEYLKTQLAPEEPNTGPSSTGGAPASILMLQALADGKSMEEALQMGKRGLRWEMAGGVGLGALSLLSAIGVIPGVLVLPALVLAAALVFAGYHWHVLKQIGPESGLSPPTRWRKIEQAIVLSMYALPGLALALTRLLNGNLPIESQISAVAILALAPLIHFLFDGRVFRPIERRLEAEDRRQALIDLLKRSDTNTRIWAAGELIPYGDKDSLHQLGVAAISPQQPPEVRAAALSAAKEMLLKTSFIRGISGQPAPPAFEEHVYDIGYPTFSNEEIADGLARFGKLQRLFPIEEFKHGIASVFVGIRPEMGLSPEYFRGQSVDEINAVLATFGPVRFYPHGNKWSLVNLQATERIIKRHPSYFKNIPEDISLDALDTRLRSGELEKIVGSAYGLLSGYPESAVLHDAVHTRAMFQTFRNHYQDDEWRTITTLMNVAGEDPELLTVYLQVLADARAKGIIDDSEKQILSQPRRPVTSLALGTFIGYNRDDERWAHETDRLLSDAWNHAVRTGIIRGEMINQPSAPRRNPPAGTISVSGREGKPAAARNANAGAPSRQTSRLETARGRLKELVTKDALFLDVVNKLRETMAKELNIPASAMTQERALQLLDEVHIEALDDEPYYARAVAQDGNHTIRLNAQYAASLSDDALLWVLAHELGHILFRADTKTAFDWRLGDALNVILMGTVLRANRESAGQSTGNVMLTTLRNSFDDLQKRLMAREISHRYQQEEDAADQVGLLIMWTAQEGQRPNLEHLDLALARCEEMGPTKTQDLHPIDQFLKEIGVETHPPSSMRGRITNWARNEAVRFLGLTIYKYGPMARLFPIVAYLSKVFSSRLTRVMTLGFFVALATISLSSSAVAQNVGQAVTGTTQTATDIDSLLKPLTPERYELFRSYGRWGQAFVNMSYEDYLAEYSSLEKERATLSQTLARWKTDKSYGRKIWDMLIDHPSPIVLTRHLPEKFSGALEQSMGILLLDANRFSQSDTPDRTHEVEYGLAYYAGHELLHEVHPEETETQVHARSIDLVTPIRDFDGISYSRGRYAAQKALDGDEQAAGILAFTLEGQALEDALNHVFGVVDEVMSAVQEATGIPRSGIVLDGAFKMSQEELTERARVLEQSGQIFTKMSDGGWLLEAGGNHYWVWIGDGKPQVLKAPADLEYADPSPLMKEPAQANDSAPARLIAELSAEIFQPLGELRHTIASLIKDNPQNASRLLDVVDTLASRNQWTDETPLNVVLQKDNGGLWIIKQMTRSSVAPQVEKPAQIDHKHGASVKGPLAPAIQQPIDQAKNSWRTELKAHLKPLIRGSTAGSWGAALVIAYMVGTAYGATAVAVTFGIALMPLAAWAITKPIRTRRAMRRGVVPSIETPISQIAAAEKEAAPVPEHDGAAINGAVDGLVPSDAPRPWRLSFGRKLDNARANLYDGTYKNVSILTAA